VKEGDVVLARCDYCGRKFSTPPNRYKKSKYHFCSRECYIKWMRTNPEIMSKKGKKQDKSTYRRLLELAKRRKVYIAQCNTL